MTKYNRYKVTRTWYVTATSKAEALSKSNQILHKEAKVTKEE